MNAFITGFTASGLIKQQILTWMGHVQKMEKKKIVKKIMKIYISGERRKEAKVILVGRQS